MVDVLDALRRRLGELCGAGRELQQLLAATGEQIPTLDLARSLVAVDGMANDLDGLHDGLAGTVAQDDGPAPCPAPPPVPPAWLDAVTGCTGCGDE